MTQGPVLERKSIIIIPLCKPSDQHSNANLQYYRTVSNVFRTVSNGSVFINCSAETRPSEQTTTMPSISTLSSDIVSASSPFLVLCESCFAQSKCERFTDFSNGFERFRTVWDDFERFGQKLEIRHFSSYNRSKLSSFPGSYGRTVWWKVAPGHEVHGDMFTVTIRPSYPI